MIASGDSVLKSDIISSIVGHFIPAHGLDSAVYTIELPFSIP